MWPGPPICCCMNLFRPLQVAPLPQFGAVEVRLEDGILVRRSKRCWIGVTDQKNVGRNLLEFFACMRLFGSLTAPMTGAIIFAGIHETFTPSFSTTPEPLSPQEAGPTQGYAQPAHCDLAKDLLPRVAGLGTIRRPGRRRRLAAPPLSAESRTPAVPLGLIGHDRIGLGSNRDWLTMASLQCFWKDDCRSVRRSEARELSFSGVLRDCTQTNPGSSAEKHARRMNDGRVRLQGSAGGLSTQEAIDGGAFFCDSEGA